MLWAAFNSSAISVRGKAGAKGTGYITPDFKNGHTLTAENGTKVRVDSIGTKTVEINGSNRKVRFCGEAIRYTHIPRIGWIIYIDGQEPRVFKHKSEIKGFMDATGYGVFWQG